MGFGSKQTVINNQQVKLDNFEECIASNNGVSDLRYEINNDRVRSFQALSSLAF
ncbi:hypothetical protein H1P_670020 [Hyella patelloides LEGE 07179]|uniref:Uncharacterized protein n=1 Tax=Hyella patelloides LEGE 07179 TaxID=945734 RepID=A0A563W2T6_9CYAN|nr:hypothetical protein H1P_670020 [Hyella patelloides LEGE 07179]